MDGGYPDGQRRHVYISSNAVNVIEKVARCLNCNGWIALDTNVNTFHAVMP